MRSDTETCETSSYCLDTSFLAHALVVSQRTTEALDGLRFVSGRADVLLVPAHVAVEFATMLLRLQRRGRMNSEGVDEAFADLLALEPEIAADGHDWAEGLSLARRIGLPETFDSTAYAVARRYDAEFWTCDRRFANAATAAGFDGFRLFD